MPGEHKNDPTISFRPSRWARALIEERAALSGMCKKDFITRSCVYSNIVVVGTAENIQRIIDALQEMQDVMKNIAGQLSLGDISLSEVNYAEMKSDFLALVITVVEISNGAAYLFNKSPPENQKNWKSELELEQYRHVLEQEQDRVKKE